MHNSSEDGRQAWRAGRRARLIRPRHLAVALVPTAAAAALAAGVAIAAPTHRDHHRTATMGHHGHHHGATMGHHKRHRGMRHRKPTEPVTVTVFSPGNGDHSGVAGAGFIVDVALDASKAKYDPLLSAQAGYKPFFNSPTASTFHPGPDPGAPGLVVLLSTTPTTPGTPFQGPDTNLAGLFQENGVARVMGNRAEVWDTWLVGKPLWGTGPETLTVYVVKGTAPANVKGASLKRISNVVRVHFHIA
jgi:hypothetical protein